MNNNIPPLNINFFQSANSEGSHIADDFVIRIEEYETIMGEIRRDPMQGSVQHYLLLGRRGSGKSTLLKRIEYEINNDPALSKKLIPVNLAEEQANIYRLMDLWEETIKELKHSDIDIDDSIINNFTGNTNEYNRQLYAAINDAMEKAGRKIVLLLDNIDRIFENIREDAALLREVLLNYDHIRIVGGSTRMSEHFWQYDAPFYNFFRIIKLEALSNEEVRTLLMHWAKAYNLPAIEDFVQTKPGQLETIRILTDGLPRTLKFFISTIINRTQKDSYQYLKQIMDYVTPLYQERLNNLPAAHRKIVLNLAFIWEAAAVKQLVEVCKIESKLLSAHLKQLYQNGLLDKIETSKKNHLYRISERFFNLWLIFTQGSPSDKRKQKCLTIFLESWYNGDEIKEMTMQHLVLLNEEVGNADDVALFSKALAHSKYISSAERDLIIDKTLRLENLAKSLKESLPSKVAQIVDEIIKLIIVKKWKEAEKLAKSIEQEDAIKEIILGHIYMGQQNYRKAEKCYLLAFEQGSNEAAINLGVVYKNQEKYNLAEKYSLIAFEKGNNKALLNLGILYEKQGKFDLAEKYYLLAIEKNDNKAFNNLGLLYERQGKFDLAEKNYLLAIKKNDTKILRNLGALYEKQRKFDLAEKYYLLSIEQDDIYSFIRLSGLYYTFGKNRKKALELILRYKDKNKDQFSDFFEIVIKLWNGIFEELQKLVFDYLLNDSDHKEILIQQLLVHHQLQLVNNLFTDKTIGEKLQQEFSPLYYATQLLSGKKGDENIALKMPPEITETVDSLIKHIKERQDFYYKK